MCTAPFFTQRFCTDFHQSGLVNEKCTSFLLGGKYTTKPVALDHRL